MVLERGVFPVPKDLKKSPLAPLTIYRHPLYSESPFNPYRYWLNAPSELQEWVRCNAPRGDCRASPGPTRQANRDRTIVELTAKR